MIEIKKVDAFEELKMIEHLARIIWLDHYEPIIGIEQIEYMLSKYQSIEAMKSQMQYGYEYYGIFFDGNLSGYFSYIKNSEEFFISKYYVHRDFRGQGLGRSGMSFIKAMAKSSGIDQIRLTVNKYNEESISIYIKMGFEVVDQVILDIGEGYVMDDYVMKLEI